MAGEEARADMPDRHCGERGGDASRAGGDFALALAPLARNRMRDSQEVPR